MIQARLTAGDLWDLMPEECTAKDKVEVKGVTISCDQGAIICGLIRPEVPLVLSRVANSQDVVFRTELMPVGVWTRLNPHGEIK